MCKDIFSSSPHLGEDHIRKEQNYAAED